MTRSLKDHLWEKRMLFYMAVIDHISPQAEDCWWDRSTVPSIGRGVIPEAISREVLHENTRSSSDDSLA